MVDVVNMEGCELTNSFLLLFAVLLLIARFLFYAVSLVVWMFAMKSREEGLDGLNVSRRLSFYNSLSYYPPLPPFLPIQRSSPYPSSILFLSSLLKRF